MRVKNKRLAIGCRPADYKGQKVLCQNASTLGFHVNEATPGCWLQWLVEIVQNKGDAPWIYHQTGRMFSSVHNWTDAQGGPEVMIGVLAMDSMSEFGMLRWVDPASVTTISKEPPKEFLQWMLGDGFLKAAADPETMLRLIEYGTLSDQHIHNVDDRIKEMAERKRKGKLARLN